jgi:hypothetical protein
MVPQMCSAIEVGVQQFPHVIERFTPEVKRFTIHPIVVNNQKTFVESRLWQLVDQDRAVDGRKAR